MAAEEDFVLSFTGEETDNLLKHTESMKNQKTADDGETVQVYDTNGVPHKVSKTELLKKSTLALPKLEDISSFVAINAAGNAVGLMTKEQVASVLAELMNENKLFPFMVKGQIEISNRNNIEELNNVVESGMYIVIPNSDTYGTLLVFQAGGGAGATVQFYLHPAGINITRIKNSNSENVWWEL